MGRRNPAGDEASSGIREASADARRHRTERSARQVQEEFLTLASHELRTPLTAVQGYLELLGRRAEIRDNEVLARYVEAALSETKRLARLVEDLTDAARLRSGKMRLQIAPVDLSELVGRACFVAQSLTDRQEIRVDVPDRLVVRGDAGRLEQVVVNIVTNAIVHVPEGRHVDVRLRGDDGEAALEVHDEGRGIPVDDLPHLFLRLYQGAATDAQSQRGLGLGLFIAQQVIASHGGRIDVESGDGKGTTFTVRLPRGV